jgi:hypothetical protein
VKVFGYMLLQPEIRKVREGNVSPETNFYQGGFGKIKINPHIGDILTIIK